MESGNEYRPCEPNQAWCAVDAFALPGNVRSVLCCAGLLADGFRCLGTQCRDGHRAADNRRHDRERAAVGMLVRISLDTQAPNIAPFGFTGSVIADNTALFTF